MEHLDSRGSSAKVASQCKAPLRRGKVRCGPRNHTSGKVRQAARLLRSHLYEPSEELCCHLEVFTHEGSRRSVEPVLEAVLDSNDLPLFGVHMDDKEVRRPSPGEK